jgi:hypothetical protein
MRGRVVRKVGGWLVPVLASAAALGLIFAGLGINTPSPATVYFAESDTPPPLNTRYLECLQVVASWTGATAQAVAALPNPRASEGVPDEAEEQIISDAESVAVPMAEQGSYAIPAYIRAVAEAIRTGCEQHFGALLGTVPSPAASPSPAPSVLESGTYLYVSGEGMPTEDLVVSSEGAFSWGDLSGSCSASGSIVICAVDDGPEFVVEAQGDGTLYVEAGEGEPPVPNATFRLIGSTEVNDAVWPEAGTLATQRKLLRRCIYEGSDCRPVVLKLGGSDAAVDFYEETGLFLVGTYPAGAVEIGFVAGPIGANFVSTGVLLSGSSTVVVDEEVSGISFKGNAIYKSVRQEYPDIFLWEGDGNVEFPVITKDGGVEVTYQLAFLDGCHACARLGTARVTFAFDEEGDFLGASPASICGEFNAAWNAGAPFCPSWIDSSAPISTSASTPRQALKMLVSAWRANDKDMASLVATSRVVDFMWLLPTTFDDIAAGECSKSDVWEDFYCSLGQTEPGGSAGFSPYAGVVGSKTNGYFVAFASFAE